MRAEAPVETVYGQIVAKANNYLVAGRRLVKNARIRAYEQAFASQCTLYAGARIDTPFTLRVTVYSRSARFDLDNSLKTLLDCLQDVGAVRDDALCRRIEAEKRIDPERPRVEFALIADDTLF